MQRRRKGNSMNKHVVSYKIQIHDKDFIKQIDVIKNQLEILKQEIKKLENVLYFTSE